VAAAIAQGRADWGLAIEHVARRLDLGFMPLTAERYDFVVPVQRLERPALQALIRLLKNKTIREQLAKLGCSPSP
jgi:putative molybdopterin biosynthesis protein